MVKTFIFDEKSYQWDKQYYFNSHFIETSIRYLCDLLELNGYLYLNRIYETFGIGWNPDEVNDCIRYGANRFVISWEHLSDNKFEIKVCY